VGTGAFVTLPDAEVIVLDDMGCVMGGGGCAPFPCHQGRVGPCGGGSGR